MNEQMRKEMVMKLAVQKARWAIGGYENAIADGDIQEMPSHNEMVNEVYKSIVSDPTLEGRNGTIMLKKDIRFIGTAGLTEIADQAVTKVVKE